tara:strand:- start:556 stop:1413 length:858 start_codon:yes stop_codon:yes gene_type:complete
MTMKNLFTIPLLFISFISFSQLKTPPASTASKIEQVVGLTEIDVNYNRPSKKGREIFGNLVPYGKLWRTGANSSTKISFSTEVVIEGKTINEGTYSVFSIPNEDNWDVILYSQAEVWGVPRDWDDNKIVFKSNFKSVKYKDSYELETFAISFKNVTNNDVDLVLSWGRVYVTVPISVPTRELVESQIVSLMKGEPKASDYYAAAVYYKEENIMLDQALVWMNKAMEMTESPRFFQLRQQSLILAANGKYREAIKVAKKSLELSVKADNQDYVKMNNDSIKEWSNK